MRLDQLLEQFRRDSDDRAEPFLWSTEDVTDWLNEAEGEACERMRLLRDTRTYPIAAGDSGATAIHAHLFSVLRAWLVDAGGEIYTLEERDVAAHLRALGRDGMDDPRPDVGRQRGDHTVTERREVEHADVDGQRAGLQPARIQEVLDDRDQPVDLAVGQLDQLAPLRFTERHILREQAGCRELRGGERCPQVVRHGPQQRGAEIVGRGELLVLGGALLEHALPPGRRVDE